MKLIIEIDTEVAGNNLEDTDLEVMGEESSLGEELQLSVGRRISEEESHIAGVFTITADKFTVRLEK